MKRAAYSLPPVPCANFAETNTAPVVFMTGTEYWHESVFCANSLLKVAEPKPRLSFISDGSLSAKHARELARLFPGATIISTDEVSQRVESQFPADQFPLIRFYRRHKPIMRKLLDVFIMRNEAQLLLDSDMLFFSNPRDLLDWTEHPQGCLGMIDVKSAYGYSRPLMEELAGNSIPEKINIGVFGMTGSDIDWISIEHWIKQLTETEGLHYNLCQCLSAMLYAQGSHHLLDSENYLILPDREESQKPTAAMHHYVAESKQWYRRFAWRQFL